MPYSYENYDVKCSTYTELRKPVGVEKQLAHFSKNPSVALEKQSLLDAGCGTGNYMLYYIHRMGSLHCSDFSEGMLAEARNNLNKMLESQSQSTTDDSGTDEEVKNRLKVIASTNKDINSSELLTLKDKVQFSKADVANLADFEDGSYDAICNNQVAHHLRPDNDFADLKAAAKEFFRVLKPSGRLAINVTLPEQQAALWFAELIPKAVAIWVSRAPTIEVIEIALKSAGFEDISSEALLDEILYEPNMYFNPKSFLDIDTFMRCDSTFNLCSPGELKDAVAKMQKMIYSDTLDEWFAQKEATRKRLGQTVNVYAVKK